LKKEKKLEIVAIIAKTAVNDENVKKLIKSWIKIYQIPKYTMHTKAILADNEYLFIWSVNFSEYSFDKNREIWILLKEEKIISKFNEIFNKDIAE
jgi:phosphatidylserine/phosphatidylglycerophosphate/cardiolipin synthase-like enzyme